tara:strand:+ start:786 stop:1376 length:591 start_codon:yes stop_codon:yes gene_type:complete
VKTSDRILIAATIAFGENGYDGTSLDSLAQELGIRKQSILYYFPTKEALLDAAVADAIGVLGTVLSEAVRNSEDGWERIEKMVRRVFRLAIQRPELLGLLREVSRLGPPTLTKAIKGFDPLIKGATKWLKTEMAKGRIVQSDPYLLVLSVYSVIMGAATEGNLLEAIGIQQTPRDVVLRRKELLRFLKSALVPIPK